MPYTEKSKEYNYEYRKKKIKRIPLDLNLEQYAALYIHTRFRGESINGFIKRAITETIKMDEFMDQRKNEVKE